MIGKKMEQGLNDQVNMELYSAYLYLSMAAYCAEQNLSGFANWMRVQFEEEQAHAMKMFDYVLDRGGNMSLKTIDQPKNQWSSILEVFEDVLAHEQKVTGLINDLTSLAIDEKDHATATMLQWFVTEQVEEEASVEDLLHQIKMTEGKGAGLLMLDRELKQRTFTPIN